MRLSNLKIGMRLELGFAILIMLLISAGLLGATRLAFLNSQMSGVVNMTHPKTVYANDIIAQDLHHLDKTISSARGRELYSLILASRSAYAYAADNVLKLIREGQRKQALQLLFTGGSFELQQKYPKDLTELVHHQNQLNEVVASVQRVTDVVFEIAAASQEQGDGIEQVNQAISQMDQTTQQNAALVEQAAAAAQSRQDQASRLGQAISVFKLADDAGNSPLRLPAAGRTLTATRQLSAPSATAADGAEPV